MSIPNSSRQKNSLQSIKINGGHVLQANVIADNGIMHVIDKVLIPQFTML